MSEFRCVLTARDEGSTHWRDILSQTWQETDSNLRGFLRFTQTNLSEVADFVRKYHEQGSYQYGYLTFDDALARSIDPIGKTDNGLWIQRSLAAFLVERGAIDAHLLVDGRAFDLKEPLAVTRRRRASQSTMRPGRLTPFFGRDREIHEIQTALKFSRWVHLAGVPGIGKSALAKIAIDEIKTEFESGTRYIDLARVDRYDALIPHVGKMLRKGDGAPVDATATIDSIARSIGTAEMLLVFDNCESARVAVGELVTHLLSHCPNLSVLTTSRVKITPGEYHTIVITSLDFPDPDATVADQAESAAVAVFIDRAQMIDPQFEFTTANSRVVIELCRRLSGNPMAIEFAARRLGTYTVQQVFTRSSDWLQILKGDPDDPRQSSLGESIRWSYESLPPEGQALFRKLSWLEGGFNQSDVYIMFGMGQTLAESGEQFSILIDHSLLAPIKDQDEKRYFIMPETIRMFGRSLTTDKVQIQSIQAQIDRWLQGSTKKANTVTLELLYPDAKASIKRLVKLNLLDDAIEMFHNTFWFWYERGFADEGIELIEEMLRSTGRSTLSKNIIIHSMMTYLTVVVGDLKRADRYSRKLHLLSCQSGDLERIGTAKLNVGRVRRLKNYPKATRWFKRALKLGEQVGDEGLIASAVSSLAGTYMIEDDRISFLDLAGRYPDLFAQDISIRSSQAQFWLKQGDLEKAKYFNKSVIFDLDEDHDLMFLLGMIANVGRLCEVENRVVDTRQMGRLFFSLASSLSIDIRVIFPKDSKNAERWIEGDDSLDLFVSRTSPLSVEEIKEILKSVITGN